MRGSETVMLLIVTFPVLVTVNTYEITSPAAFTAPVAAVLTRRSDGEGEGPGTDSASAALTGLSTRSLPVAEAVFDQSPTPTEFAPATRKQYVVPGCRPVMVAPVEPAPTEVDAVKAAHPAGLCSMSKRASLVTTSAQDRPMLAVLTAAAVRLVMAPAGATVAGSQAVAMAPTSRRPPVTVLPASEAVGAAVDMIL